MLIAQDLILVTSDASHRTCSGFASDADRTRLQLGSPQMLIAQDLILVASDADRTGLTCFASDASHRTCSGFASDADCTGLDLGRLGCFAQYLILVADRSLKVVF